MIFFNYVNNLKEINFRLIASNMLFLSNFNFTKILIDIEDSVQ